MRFPLFHFLLSFYIIQLVFVFQLHLSSFNFTFLLPLTDTGIFHRHRSHFFIIKQPLHYKLEIFIFLIHNTYIFF